MRVTTVNWVRYFLSVIVAIPVSVIVTIVFAPVWRWFESISGIESIGHSGPATWCYIVVYVVFLVIGILVPGKNLDED